MLDLVIERPVQQVGQRVGAHVARGQHLRAQEVERLTAFDLRHALVVGREDRGQVEAAHALVDHDHHQRTPGADQRHQQGDVGDRVQPQRDQLGGAMTHARADERLHALDVHDPGQAEEQREEEVGLVGGDEAGHARFAGRLFAGVGDHADVDVGIQVDVVRVAVVRVVLARPPARAHAEQAVAGEEGDQTIEAPVAKHLLVSRIVELEAELAGHDAQPDGDQRGQPGIARQAEQRPAGGEGEQVGRQQDGVVGGALVKQAGRLDAALQLGVVGRLGWGWADDLGGGGDA